MISLADLREFLAFDPTTGIFTVAKERPGFRVGRQLTGTNAAGYVQITIGRQFYYGHRLAWFHFYGEWPTLHIDHVNGEKGDNRPCNLRLATRFQNMANSKIRSHNTSGFKGVQPRNGRWTATIRVNNKNRHVGTFDSPQAAADAYWAAAQELHGEFARAA